MDAIHVAIAIIPLSAYFLRIGVLNLRRQPTVRSGMRDAAALALGIAGCVFAGPFELFFPETASYSFGPVTWIAMAGLYLLVVTLILLMIRPRLVIYHGNDREIRLLLNRVTQDLDPQSEWAGDGACCPNLGIQFHIEHQSIAQTIQLIATGPTQSFEGWKHLESSLRNELRALPMPPGRIGFSLLGVSILLLAFSIMSLMAQHETLARSLSDMLRWY